MKEHKKPYLIDAIVGNSSILASLTRTGRLVRLWWPHIDFPQHVDEIRSGIRVDGYTSSTSWFDTDQDGWKHAANYQEGTNIFQIAAHSDQNPIQVSQTDFAVPNEDIYVRLYSFTHSEKKPLSFQFIHYSAFNIAENNYYQTTQFNEENDALMHFRRQYFFSVSSANVCSNFQAGFAWDQADREELQGEQINMASDGALAWSFKDVLPGTTIHVPIYITAGKNQEASIDALKKAKNKPFSHWKKITEDYWKQFLQSEIQPCPIDQPNIKKLYERSLLTMKLMSDEKSGSIVAAPEFDEHFSRCGGYGFCWGRDAAFITTALDKSGLTSLSSRFYDWALTAQDADGSWQQRHYHDGCLAPSWGIQIDEGASIIWGMWQHYQQTKNHAFAEKVWPSVHKGAAFLHSFIDKKTDLPLPSNDLWEERNAEHIYSAAAVHGALIAAASFAENQKEYALATEWKQTAERIQTSIKNNGWNANKRTFYRGLKLKVSKNEYDLALSDGVSGYTTFDDKGYPTYWLDHDPIVDISLIGLSVPFLAIDIDDPKMIGTVKTIEDFLSVPGVGGIKRYENDRYIGGNPWILTTLWLAHYYIHAGQLQKAESYLQWTLDHQTEMGLLPEQIDQNTGETAWVVPLTWSHAMFVLAVHWLAEKM